MEDWAEIRRLYRSEKLSQAEIARQLGLARNTVANAVRSDSPPRYERPPVTTSAWAQIEPAERAVLKQYPTMAASVIAERVGWSGGHSWFSENAARTRLWISLGWSSLGRPYPDNKPSRDQLTLNQRVRWAHAHRLVVAPGGCRTAYEASNLAGPISRCLRFHLLTGR